MIVSPRLVRVLSLMILVAAGCSGDSPMAPPPSGVKATHGGDLFPLPGGRGCAEVAVEPENATAKGAQATKSRINLYLTNKDGSAVPSPAPTEVTFNDGLGKSLKFDADPNAGGTSAHYKSEPTSLLPGKGLTGEFAIAFGTDSIKLPVASH